MKISLCVRILMILPDDYPSMLAIAKMLAVARMLAPSLQLAVKAAETPQGGEDVPNDQTLEFLLRRIQSDGSR